MSPVGLCYTRPPKPQTHKIFSPSITTTAVSLFYFNLIYFGFWVLGSSIQYRVKTTVDYAKESEILSTYSLCVA